MIGTEHPEQGTGAASGLQSLGSLTSGLLQPEQPAPPLQAGPRTAGCGKQPGWRVCLNLSQTQSPCPCGACSWE